MRHRVVVTGANGILGREIVSRAVEHGGRDMEIIAAVRSERAAAQVPPIPPDLGRVERIDYEDPETLRKACEGASALVHLPGILIESETSIYETAHVHTTAVAVQAAQSCEVRKLVLVSAFGADSGSQNRYFRTKGEAENLVSASGIPFAVLRAPLLLGPHTEGAHALQRETSSRTAWLLGGGRTLHQPMDVVDLADAVLHAALVPEVAAGKILDVGGPEQVPYRELVGRAARLRGVDLRIRSVPVAPVRLWLKIRTRFFGPGLSPEVLEVLLTDTVVDAQAAATEIGIRLTPLDVSLRRSFFLPEGG
jgi:NADH dehydrogenase